jgi:uncharacterized protein YbjQ (UPF0145 family)
MIYALLVESVRPAGEAFKAGIERDDILISYNGQQLETTEILIGLASSTSQDSNKIEIIRGQTHKIISVGKGALGVSVLQKEINADAISTAIERKELSADRIERARCMIITTAPSIEGYRVTDTIEIVSAECAYGINIFRDFFVGVSDIVGGRSNTIQTVLRAARRNCLEELKIEALDVGANAVIAIDLDYSEISGGGKSMLFLVATGTAVKIVQREDK